MTSYRNDMKALLESIRLAETADCGCGPDCNCGGKCGGECGGIGCTCACGERTGNPKINECGLSNKSE